VGVRCDQGGGRGGVVQPRIPINTRQTPYEVVEVGVARQTCKVRMLGADPEAGFAISTRSNVATIGLTSTSPTSFCKNPANKPTSWGATSTLPPPYIHPTQRKRTRRLTP
jgi:hypothetical protein